MKLVSVLALLVALAAAQEEWGRDRDEDYVPYVDPESDEGDWYHTEPRRYYTEDPRIGRSFFGFSQWEINDMVEAYRDELTGELTYRFRGFDDVMEEYLAPEICYMTSENFTIYNNRLLDTFLLEQLEKMSPDCQSFKCDVVHYAQEHGARIFVDILNSTSMQDAIQMVGDELAQAIDELHFCTCGREFFGAIFAAAPFYNPAIFDDGLGMYHSFTRNVDMKSAGRAFDQLIEGVCASGSEGGSCLDDMFDVAGEVMDMYDVTYGEWDDYSDGNKKAQRQQQKRCDAFFGVVHAFERAGEDNEGLSYLDPSDGEDFWHALFDQVGAGADALYCAKGCKKQRTRLYPCCMRKMLENDKIWDNVAKVIESIHLVYPILNYDVEWDGFYELDRYEMSREELEEWSAWTIPEDLREKFMRAVHAAKYCEGNIVRCYN